MVHVRNRARSAEHTLLDSKFGDRDFSHAIFLNLPVTVIGKESTNFQ